MGNHQWWSKALVTPAVTIACCTWLSCELLADCLELRHTVPLVRLHGTARGLNLSGQLDQPGSTLQHVEALRTLRSRGMTGVRLPIPAEKVMTHFSNSADISMQLATIESLTAELVSLGFSVAIDLHPGREFAKLYKQQPFEGLQALLQAWSALAEIIRRFPAQFVFAELLNEPDIDASRWQSDAIRLSAHVRRLLPKTTIIVGPVNWQRPDALESFKPLEDLNVIYAIHFYDPMAFTHQGHWDRNDPLHNIRQLPYPIRKADEAVVSLQSSLLAGNDERGLLELNRAIAKSESGDVVVTQLAPALRWQTRHRRPIIVNEFGVLKHHAPPEGRNRWLRSVVEEAERNCWGWLHWEFAHGFGLLTKDWSLDEGTVGALLDR